MSILIYLKFSQVKTPDWCKLHVAGACTVSIYLQLLTKRLADLRYHIKFHKSNFFIKKSNINFAKKSKYM